MSRGLDQVRASKGINKHIAENGIQITVRQDINMQEGMCQMRTDDED